MTNEANTAANVAEQGAHVAPEKGKSKQGASQKEGAPKGKKTAKGGKPAKKPAGSKGKTSRAESKGAKVQELMRRAKGVTLGELMKATGWQSHSIRGFISGTLTKKLGLKVESFKPEGGERSYRIK